MNGIFAVETIQGLMLFAEIRYLFKTIIGRFSDCQIEKKESLCVLKKSHDQSKDQTYFLNDINKEVLNKCLFPIGDIEKSQVREIAKSRDLVTYDKKDSTGKVRRCIGNLGFSKC